MKADDKTLKNPQQDRQLVVTPYPHGEQEPWCGQRDPWSRAVLTLLLQMGLPAIPGIKPCLISKAGRTDRCTLTAPLPCSFSPLGGLLLPNLTFGLVLFKETS